MSNYRKSIGAAFVLFSFVFLVSCQERREEAEGRRRAQENKRPAQISWENGQATLVLDAQTQSRLGLETVTLVETATRAQVTSPAVVLSARDLATFRNSYFATRTQLEKSRIEAAVAKNEYTRLKTLFNENQNVSEKSLQSAEGMVQTNEEDVRSGEQQLSLEESVVRQEWGGVVAGWAVNGSPQLQRVLDQREVLVQMTIPPSAAFIPPTTIALEIPGGGRTQASYVSPLPRVDPRIQGRAFLYLAPVQSGLTPGINLVAHLAIGAQMKGLIVPSSAVIWSEGKAWVYQQTGGDHFTRRAMDTGVPVEQGFFVAQGFSARDRILVRGAQALLSEELLLHGQGGEQADVD